MRLGRGAGADITGGGETKIGAIADDPQFGLIGKTLRAKFYAEVRRGVVYHQDFPGLGKRGVNALGEEWPGIIIYDDDRDRKLGRSGIHVNCHSYL